MKKFYLFLLVSLATLQITRAEEEKVSVGKELWHSAKPWVKIGTGVTTLGIHVLFWLYGTKTIGTIEEGLGLKLKTLLEGTLLPQGSLRDESEIDENNDYSGYSIVVDRGGNIALLTIPVIPSWYLIQSGISDLRKKNEQKLEAVSEEKQEEKKQELDNEVQWYLKAKNKAKELAKKVKESIGE